MPENKQEQLKMKRLFLFFIPLGLSSSLMTISHLIINSTLARSVDPEKIIASYAIAMSLFGITEYPAILLRQTCSALVRDRLSFRATWKVAMYVFSFILAVGVIITYTPVGTWIFVRFFGADVSLLHSIIQVYMVLMFVSVFSALRCLYQGVIIANMRTKWLLIGMVIRLVAMYLVSLYFLQSDRVTTGQVGAIIFLTGMVIECTVSYLEGSKLVRSLPEKLEHHAVEKAGHVYRFYRPLLYSSFIAVFAIPSINAFLGKTTHIELAIASFAIAANLTELVLSSYYYIYQVVLNFYRIDAAVVRKFVLLLCCIPGLLIGILGYTQAGPFLLTHVVGVNEALMQACILNLRVFMIMAFIYPWIDFCNGLVMLSGQTRVMVWTQTANVLLILSTLICCVSFTPGWNGMIGALAQSIGLIGELVVMTYALKQLAKPKELIAGMTA